MSGDGGTKLTTAREPSGLLPLDNTGTRGTGSAIDLLHRVLTELLADPDSTEPFDLVLAHILELSGAQSGTIFVTTESGRQLVLLSCIGPDDRDRWMRIIRERDLHRRNDGGTQSDAFADPENSRSTILAQGFAQGTSGRGLLLLRLTGHRTAVPPSALETLRSYGDYLAGILYSARCVRMKLRNAQSEERAVIARELHDSLAQSLSYLRIQVSLLQTMLQKREDPASDVDAALQKLRSTLSTADLQLRELITTFRLTMHGRTFAQALEDSIEEFEQRSSIAFDLDNRLPVGVLTVAEEMQLLLILREALCNVVRHSHASYCWVSVRLAEDGAVHLGVEDNGIGMRQAMHDTEPHHGLVIMQERAHSLGGSLRLEDRKEGGMRLHVRCPREGGTLSSTL